MRIFIATLSLIVLYHIFGEELKVDLMEAIVLISGYVILVIQDIKELIK